MNYQEQLSPWVIHQLLPNLKQITVARFRHRNDAEAYMRLVSRIMPHKKFAIAFETQVAELRHASTNSSAPQAAMVP